MSGDDIIQAGLLATPPNLPPSELQAAERLVRRRYPAETDHQPVLQALGLRDYPAAPGPDAVTRAPRSRDTRVRDQVLRRLHNEGMPLTAIAAELGMTQQMHAVRAILRDHAKATS